MIAVRSDDHCLLCLYPFYNCSSNHSQKPLQLPQHNMSCLSCVITLHNVMQFIWVPNPLCRDTEWSGVLLNLFVPPRMKIADGAGPGSVNSTHNAHANSVVATCQKTIPVSCVLLVNIILE